MFDNSRYKAVSDCINNNSCLHGKTDDDDKNNDNINEVVTYLDCSQYKLLICDEPTGNLDPSTSEEVFSALLEVIQETGLSALVATHNMELAARMNKQIRLVKGSLEDVNQPFFSKVKKNFY